MTTAAGGASSSVRSGPSLRTRLIAAVAVVIALGIGVESFIEIRLFDQGMERELRETGLVIAEAVVDDLELRRAPWPSGDLQASLHEFAQSAPSVQGIAIVRIDGAVPVIVASTASTDSPVVLELGRRTLIDGETGWHDDGGVSRIARRTEVQPTGRTAVVVTVTLAALAQTRQRARVASLWLVPVAVIAVIVVLDQVLRRLVHRPLADLRHTMTRAGAGDRAARAPIARGDELGELAAGLNRMLDQLADFNTALESRIHDVTAERDQSYADRIDAYQRMLALREALARAEALAAIGQTAASVAHQVGTPLNLISGHVQVLLADPHVDADVARRLRVIEEQIGRVSESVREMLQYGRAPGEIVSLDLAALVHSLTTLVQPRLDAAGVQLDLQLPAPAVLVRGRRYELELALLNLVSNAIDAMPGGGRLALILASGPDTATLTVRDTGGGIATDLLPRVFEPWVTTKPPGRGTGLGLSITRDVLTRLGGAITVDSRPGEGTTVVVTLRIADQDDSYAHPVDRG